jgi:hypothetical protein
MGYRLACGNAQSGGSMTTQDYLFLRAWCYLMDYNDRQTERELAAARTDNAPRNAIFKNTHDIWWTVEDIERPSTKRLLTKIANVIKESQGQPSTLISEKIRDALWQARGSENTESSG